MEDTKSLLMMVLHKIFQNQPKIIEDTFQLIHSFNNGKIEKRNYEKTLKTICDLLNDELPSPILVYILTLVDMPQDFDSQSPIVEKMRKTHDFLPDINVRPHLLEYLNKAKPARATKNNTVSEKTQTTEKPQIQEKPKENVQEKPRNRRTRRLLQKNGSPKRLLDIAACYVVSHENALKSMYKKKQTMAWTLINSNMLNEMNLKQCYSLVKDLNKKMRWLREIESENISLDMLKEEYKNSDVFMKESHIYHELEKDPFHLSKDCEQAIEELFQ